MSFKKIFFGAIFTAVFLLQTGAAWAARLAISGDGYTGGGGAIDTLTFSGGFSPNSTTAPAASEMLIFSTFNGDSPDTVRNRIVAAGAGLSNFTVTPVAGYPNQFEVENIPAGGSLVILLDGDEVTTDPGEGSAYSNAGQYFYLTATQIPTFSEWGLILFATLLLAGLVWFIRRRSRLAQV